MGFCFNINEKCVIKTLECLSSIFSHFIWIVKRTTSEMFNELLNVQKMCSEYFSNLDKIFKYDSHVASKISGFHRTRYRVHEQHIRVRHQKQTIFTKPLYTNIRVCFVKAIRIQYAVNTVKKKNSKVLI